MTQNDIHHLKGQILILIYEKEIKFQFIVTYRKGGKLKSTLEIVKTKATFPNDPRVIHKTQKKFNSSSLAVTKNRDVNERSIVDKGPLCGPVNSYHLHLK